MAENITENLKKRSAQRRSIQAEVEIEYERFADFLSVFSGDVSEGGMFITTSHPAEVGAAIGFKFAIKGTSHLIQGTGEVMWVRPVAAATVTEPAGMGIRFVDMDTESRQILKKMLGSAEKFEAVVGKDKQKRSIEDIMNDPTLFEDMDLSADGLLGETHDDMVDMRLPENEVTKKLSNPSADEFSDAGSTGDTDRVKLELNMESVEAEHLMVDEGSAKKKKIVMGLMLLLLLGGGFAGYQMFFAPPAPEEVTIKPLTPRATTPVDRQEAEKPAQANDTVAVPSNADKAVTAEQAAAKPAGEVKMEEGKRPATAENSMSITTDSGEAKKSAAPAAAVNKDAALVGKVAGILVSLKSSATTFVLELDGVAASDNVTSLLLRGDKPRFVLDVMGIAESKLPAISKSRVKTVSTVRTGAHKNPDKVRVVFDLTENIVEPPKIWVEKNLVKVAFPN